MNIKKHTLFPILFLFIFLSAFSAGLYSNFNNSSKALSHFSLHKELKQDANNNITASEELVFEETENDREGSLDSEFTLIPAFLNFDFYSSILKTKFSDLLYSEKTSGSIFLSIRVIRI